MTPLMPGDDAAQAQTELPVPPAAVHAFLVDCERLWRLNPMLAIARWQPLPDGFAVAGDNESNGRAFAFTARCTAGTDGLRVDYAEGIKRSTEFAVVPRDGGTLLAVTEHYRTPDGADDPSLADVDRSLVPWVAALRRHLIARQRWARLPGWLWWHERFMPGLPPRQRRIVRLLLWVGLLEFVAFAGVVLAWRWMA